MDLGLSVRTSLPAPTLILGVGVSGSGKSTLLRALAKRIANPVYLDKDTINYSFLRTAIPGDYHLVSRYRLEGLPIPRADPTSTHYRDYVWRQSYHVMLALAQQNLALGVNPILEGNYVKEIRRGYIESVLQPFFGPGLRWRLVLAYAAESVIIDRQTTRAASHDPCRSPAEWRGFFAEQPPYPPELAKYPHVAVDTSQGFSEEDLRRVLAFVGD